MNGRPGQRAAGYEARQVEAARRVIVELWQILGAYREAMVLVGGWVPDLLLPRATPPHTGSIDVDLLLNPEPLREGQYAELLRAIETRGYRRTKPFRFAKDVVVDGVIRLPSRSTSSYPRVRCGGRTRRSAMVSGRLRSRAHCSPSNRLRARASMVRCRMEPATGSRSRWPASKGFW